MNVFTFDGNLGGDSELRFTTSGESVLSFNVAAKSGFGEKAVTSWIRCNLWGKRAGSLEPYLKKGKQVFVTGEFTARPYADKEGNQKISNEIRVNDIKIVGDNGGGDQKPSDNQRQTRQNPVTVSDLDEDLPF